ncbi:pyridoxamine 5'-phosphate oxidase family protein [Lacisediminihabitans sp. FW035]
MSRQYGCIAFTDDVRRVQKDYGSAEFYARMARHGHNNAQVDALGAREVSFLEERDGFYVSTVSQTGWPYVQFRGGPPGFVSVLDEHTIAWPEYRGNLQHVSTGNLAGGDRVALIAVDYPNRRRLKLFGMARAVRAEDDPSLISSLRTPDYDALIEAGIVVAVTAYDWNCPQHIPQRFTTDQVEKLIAPLRERIHALETQIADSATMALE